MKRLVLLMLVVFVGAALMQGCGRKEGELVKEEELAASVEDWTLTKQALFEMISKLPEAQKRKYDTPAGRAELADRIMSEELFYREALKDNLASKDWVKKQIDEATRGILVAAYFKDKVEAKARPSDKELREYYDSHLDMYVSLPVARAQHIFSKSKEKLDDIKRQIEEGGEKMTTMAHNYSEDPLTQAEGGDLGYFNPGGYMRGIGFSQVLGDTIFKMEPAVIHGPIKWEKGYSLIRVNEIKPAQQEPFEDVKGKISDVLTKERLQQVRNEVVGGIRKDYDCRNFMEEYYRTIQRSPEELFEFAQAANDPNVRIKAFEEIVEKFPDDKHAPQALFMVGFVYLEELKDKVSADKAFNNVLVRYPDSDVAESARWMLDNLDKPVPEFQDMDDLKAKTSGKSGD